MIEFLLPPAVASAESRGDLEGSLFAEEEMAVATAREARRREFITGRVCARRALAQFGVSAVGIPVGYRGAPRWPRGYVGSIAHCPGYRGAVVARDAALASLGIDAEPNLPLPAGVLDSIAGEQERCQLERLTSGKVSWDRLIFCAKEAVFKAWFPIAGRWLNWRDVTVVVFPSTGTFGARIHADLAPSEGGLRSLNGRWLAQDDLLLTSVVIAGALR